MILRYALMLICLLLFCSVIEIDAFSYTIYLHLPSRIGTQQAEATFKKELAQIASPRHPRYQDFGTKEYTDNILQANSTNINIISTWLVDHQKIVQSRDNIKILAKKVLKFEIHNRIHFDQLLCRKHDETDFIIEYRIRHDHVKICNETIHSLVSVISGSRLWQPGEKANEVKSFVQQPPGPILSMPLNSMTNIASFYHMPIPSSIPNVNVTSIIAGSGANGYFNPPDGLTFLTSEYGVGAGLLPEGYAPSINIIYTDGMTNDPDQAMLEGSTDFEMVLGMNPFVQLTVWLSNSNYLDVFVEFYEMSDPLPAVFSMSYGDAEINQGPTLIAEGEPYVSAVGVRGVTMIFASGDNGANAITCADISELDSLFPVYPATSAYVVATGATDWYQFNSSNLYQIEEIAANYIFYSGGGFSAYLQPTTTNQLLAQQNYFETIPSNIEAMLPPSNYYNPNNRGIPDISMNGQSFAVVVNGGFTSASGTSIAAPLFNGFVTRLNAESLQYTGKTLGYILPLLYEIANDPIYGPLSFNKITVGNNNCGYGGCGYSCYGYYCTNATFNPVTGIGTPFYDGILSYLVNEIWIGSSSSSTGISPPVVPLSETSVQTCKIV
jgi:Subtilase family